MGRIHEQSNRGVYATVSSHAHRPHSVDTFSIDRCNTLEKARAPQTAQRMLPPFLTHTHTQPNNTHTKCSDDQTECLTDASGYGRDGAATDLPDRAYSTLYPCSIVVFQGRTVCAMCEIVCDGSGDNCPFQTVRAYPRGVWGGWWRPWGEKATARWLLIHFHHVRLHYPPASHASILGHVFYSSLRLPCVEMEVSRHFKFRFHNAKSLCVHDGV